MGRWGGQASLLGPCVFIDVQQLVPGEGRRAAAVDTAVTTDAVDHAAFRFVFLSEAYMRDRHCCSQLRRVLSKEVMAESGRTSHSMKAICSEHSVPAKGGSASDVARPHVLRGSC